jgi:hypothetical protein
MKKTDGDDRRDNTPRKRVNKMLKKHCLKVPLKVRRNLVLQAAKMDEIKRNKIIVLGRHVMKKYRMRAWARQNLKQDA